MLIAGLKRNKVGIMLLMFCLVIQIGIAEEWFSFVVKPRHQTPKPQTQKGPRADTKLIQATHPPTTTHKLLSMKEGSHNNTQRVRTS